MAEHTIETRILLRYDTLSNWLNSTVILKRGEAAVAAAPFSYTIEGTNDRPENTPPAIGIKIGDGYHYFYELPWIQGIAGDVYTWAKQQTKPIYNANEIQGLATFVQQYAGGGQGGGGDVTVEARSYRLAQINNKYYLQSKGANDSDWVTDELTFIDLSQLASLLTWLGTAVDDYWTIGGYTNQKITDKLNTLNYTDTEDLSKVVTAVDQVNGKISVTHRTLSTSNLSGILSVSKGGTGRNTLEQDSVLVGNGSSAVSLRPIETELTNNNNLATNRAIITYINNATAGLTGAMHFIGEATVEIRNGSSVNPRIDGYNFSTAQPGDVILFDQQEYVWNRTWILLGDEGSYAVKGSITNADIADDADIAQSKIANLTNDLSLKVDKISGKQLSTNDFTDEYKQKLLGIEDNAQRNIIEHVYVNGTEAIPTTIEGNPNSLSLRVSALTPEEEEKIGGIENGAQVNKIEHIFLNSNELNITTVKNLAKSVNIILNEYTEAEQLKLAGIESGAQVNTIEKIFFNETQFQPNAEKEVHVVIDEAALNLQVIKGARVPNSGLYEDVDITQDKKLELARIAKTGNINDIVQTYQTYVILDCGSSTEVL